VPFKKKKKKIKKNKNKKNKYKKRRRRRIIIIRRTDVTKFSRKSSLKSSCQFYEAVIK